MSVSLIDRYGGRIARVLSCYDRVVINCTIAVICDAAGMTSLPYAKGYSLIDLREIVLGWNRRYLVHLSALDDFSAGVRRADPMPAFGAFSPHRLSRHLRRLRDLCLIERVTGTYRYSLTKAGRAATAAACRITEAIIIPAMIRWDFWGCFSAESATS